MTLYYSLVFLLLVFEMVVFVALVIPMPFAVKRKLFTFISESQLVAKLQYGLKITFIGVLILFVDSVNRVYRVQLELSNANKAGTATTIGGTERIEVQTRKFYSQRNMYLCGFTLFLSLILNRQYVMILDVLRLEEENKQLRGDTSVDGKSSAALRNAGNAGEIGRLKKDLEATQKALEAKDQDLTTLQRQAANLTAEYNRMGDRVSPVDITPRKDR